MNNRDKIGIKFLDPISYEQFESFQYLLHYDFDYFDMDSEKIIELDIEDEDEEDRAEDMEVFQALLEQFDSEGLAYELYIHDDEEWKKQDSLSSII